MGSAKRNPYIGESARDFIARERKNPAVAATMDKLRLVRQLRELREQLGVTQGELARRLKTTQSVVARFERRERVPTFEFIERVARALGVRVRVELEGRPGDARSA
jgi:ribosome-binding protein aMBF1 (putative translation factor)